MESQLSPQDVAGLLELINRAPIKGEEAEGVAMLKIKLKKHLLQVEAEKKKEE